MEAFPWVTLGTELCKCYLHNLLESDIYISLYGTILCKSLIGIYADRLLRMRINGYVRFVHAGKKLSL